MTEVEKIKLIEDDLFSLARIGSEIIEFTQELPSIVWLNIANEIDTTGYNVNKESLKYEVIPHVFNENMIDFYVKSNGFIYESIIEGWRTYRRLKWSYIIQLLLNLERSKDRIKIKILLYGDSVGTDSIYLAQLGFDVYYLDYESYCAKFAAFRFKNRNLNISVINSLENSNLKFDYIMCLEVAEHMINPIDLIQELSNNLTEKGICIFSEGFALLYDKFPTHLESNRIYIGKTKKLFRKAGLFLIAKDYQEKPFYFSKFIGHRLNNSVIRYKLKSIFRKIVKR